jgi:6-phosphogluconate dehydrogenase
MPPTGDSALIELAVMGRNLILNMNDHGPAASSTYNV